LEISGNIHITSLYRLTVTYINLEQRGIVKYDMQPDGYLNKSKPVVAIGLSRAVSLLWVLIRIYSDLSLYYSIILCIL